MKNFKLLLVVLGLWCTQTTAQTQVPLSEQLAQTAMNIWPDSFLIDGDKVPKWRYDQGVILTGIERVWYATGKVAYFNYVQKSMDYYVLADGTIKGYKPEEYNIDHLNNGRQLLFLFQITGKEKYKKAVQLLREQLITHPRTRQGGFWHKEIYPWQMWLDGLYMGQPFYAGYAATFGVDSIWQDVANQFVWMEANARDSKTGLLYHGWDESREQLWADKTTGKSPHFWGRALGWYGMALVDVLDVFPEQHPRRKELVQILQRLANAVLKVQDAKTGLWYDIVDRPTQKPNYPEASASAMLTYTLAKGIRKGYLPESMRTATRKAFDGMVQTFIVVENGQTNLYGTVSVSGLGGKPYRDGSFEYYMSEKTRVNDPKGLGAMIQCAVEMELMPTLGTRKTVLLDRYFNSEKRENSGGRLSYWHYTWEEKSHPGFYAWGQLIEKYGGRLASLDRAPDPATLKHASVYIIVDPDNLKDNAQPNLIQPKHVEAIKAWVKSGGTLVLMANDSSNCELKQFNLLATAFGIQFTNLSRNMVKQDAFEQGAVQCGDNAVFQGNYTMYLKEISTLNCKPPASPLILKNGEVLFATAVYGKGRVFAVGDPWLYNEYVDGRKLPAQYENHRAADDVARWLLNPKKSK